MPLLQQLLSQLPGVRALGLRNLLEIHLADGLAGGSRVALLRERRRIVVKDLRVPGKPLGGLGKNFHRFIHLAVPEQDPAVGILDRRGFRRSPESPTPAVMPVNAGKIMAKTRKKLSGFETLPSSETSAGALDVGFPRKNIPSEMTRIPTTTQNAETPMLAPRRIIRVERTSAAGIEIILVSGANPM